jgi:hypothetical protein
MKRSRKKHKRTCLRCERQFLSDGKFNRICGSCREINANILTSNSEVRFGVNHDSLYTE